MTNKVLLIVIDGCRPDGIVKAATPSLDKIIAEGSHCFSGTTVTPSITLPAHFSIFSSRQPHAHNVVTNTGNPSRATDCPTIFEVAKYLGKTTGACYSWEHLRNLSPPGTLDWSLMIKTLDLGENSQDSTIAKHALPLLREFHPDFGFVYFEGADIAGHKYGWMSDEYLEAIEYADQAIGYLLAGLYEADIAYNVFIVSDHGGLDTHHSERVSEVLTVPWISSGPVIRKQATFSVEPSVLDIAPTIAALLGIPVHWEWEGRVIEEILKPEVV